MQIFLEKAKIGNLKKLVIAAAEDIHVLKAVQQACTQRIIEPLFVGNQQKVNNICNEIGFDISSYQLYHEPDPGLACAISVNLINSGKADILMKGHVDSKIILKAILNRSNGIRSRGLISHVAIFESPYYHKLLGLSDAAININLDLNEKKKVIENAVEVFHKIGILNPKVAVLHSTEKVNFKLRPSVHGEKLQKMNETGKIKGCIIQGPLALDNAISVDSAKHKGIIGDVAGDADILITPNIYSGNILYKSLNFLGGAFSAGIITGAKVPVVLTSRADSDKSKLMSIALACIVK